MTAKMEECFELILDRWSQPTPGSPCGECPLRDVDFDPMFGIGNRRNPSVIVVAESPNDPGSSDIHSDSRPGNREGVRTDIINYWKSAETSTKASWRTMARRFNEMFDGVVVGGREGIYLTNVWRCSNNKRRRNLNSTQIQEARERCLKYLAEELTNAGSVPIVTLGQKALDGVLDALGDEGLSGEVRSRSFATDVAIQGAFHSGTNGAWLLPAFHWSRGEALVALHESRRAHRGYLEGVRDRLRNVLGQAKMRGRSKEK